MPLTFTGILETALYTPDLDLLERFYQSVLCLDTLYADERMRALKVSPSAVLLLFKEGASTEGTATERGFIPGHDGVGPAHFCLSIQVEEVDAWRGHLLEKGVEIVSEVPGMGKGRSLYFYDPDGHCVELAPPCIWPDLERKG